MSKHEVFVFYLINLLGYNSEDFEYLAFPCITWLVFPCSGGEVREELLLECTAYSCVTVGEVLNPVLGDWISFIG